MTYYCIDHGQLKEVQSNNLQVGPFRCPTVWTNFVSIFLKMLLTCPLCPAQVLYLRYHLRSQHCIIKGEERTILLRLIRGKALELGLPRVRGGVW